MRVIADREVRRARKAKRRHDRVTVEAVVREHLAEARARRITPPVV
jgi:hypothetical protein